MKTTAPDPLRDTRVAVVQRADAAGYPPEEAAPYHPATAYPEYRGPLGPAPNHAYALVRQALLDLGLDAAHAGTPDWNPIGDLAEPGARIVVKPNWVLHRNEGPGGTDCLFTHAAILRAVLDYVLLARPRAVVVGDAPVQVCDFAAVQQLGFQAVERYLRERGAPIEVKDFRRTTMLRSERTALVSEERHGLDEFVLVDLGARSRMEPISADARRFRVTMYDPRRMQANHRPGLHRYLVSRDILEADLVINVPKLKTHKKAGLTAALKNLVGINGNKDYLPHHRKGAANRGGDNYERATLPKRLAEWTLDLANRHLHWPRFYARTSRLAYRFLFFDRIRGLPVDVEGGWHGNDTVWRMCLDLNAVLLYADAQGRMHDTPQRRTLNITDALLAGEGDGPLRPDPYPLGTVVAAPNPAAHDWIGAYLLGFDPARIPISAQAFAAHAWSLAAFAPGDIAASVNGRAASSDDLRRAYPRAATPPPGWRGHCERAGDPTV